MGDWWHHLRSRLGLGKEDDWASPPQLAALKEFYAREADHPEEVGNEEFLAEIRKAFWATNCWSFVEAAFAIIAPGCARRPHLARELIRAPIDAMIAGGLEDPGGIVAQGVALAEKSDPYVKPTEEGRAWLLTEWPKLEAVARAVFEELLRENEADDFEEQAPATGPGLVELTCPECSASFFSDGSLAGAEIPCPECSTTIRLPGERPAHWEAKTEDYEYTLYGQHPVQAEGTVAGHPFYFRAKWDFWDFSVSVGGGDPLGVEPSDQQEGFFQDGEQEGYWIGEDYGEGTEAGAMKIETSRIILERCLGRFLKDLRER